MKCLLPLPDGERAYLADMRALTTDAGGDEILVGLTRDESLAYLAFAHRPHDDHDPEARDHYLLLHDKHELARIDVVVCEGLVRRGEVTRQ